MEAVLKDSLSQPATSREELLRILSENSLFADIPKEVLQKYVDRIRILHLSENDLLYEDSDGSQSIYLVGQGHICFYIRSEHEGGFIQVDTCEARGFFGEGAALEQRQGRITRPVHSRARIVAGDATILVVLAPELLREMIQAYPMAMAANLTRAASQKSRRSAQGQFDAAIERETNKFLENMLDWFSERTLDAISVLQLNCDTLKEFSRKQPLLSDIGNENLEACSALHQALTALTELSSLKDHPLSKTRLNLEKWWNEFSPKLTRLLDTRGGTLESYVESRVIHTDVRRLERGFLWCFDSISQVLESGHRVSVSGGTNHGKFEFRISFRFPMITEYLARRLLLPFSVEGEYSNICMGFSLFYRLIVSIGGNLELDQRSGEHLTFAANLPIYIDEGA